MSWNQRRNRTVRLTAVMTCLFAAGSLGCAATETGVGSDVAGCEVTEYRAGLDDTLPFGTPRDIVEPVLGEETAPGWWLESGQMQEVSVAFELRKVSTVAVSHSKLAPDADIDQAEACNTTHAEFPFRVSVNAGPELQVTADFTDVAALPTYGLSHTWFVARDQVGGALGARTEFEQIRFYTGVYPCDECPSGRRLRGGVRGIPYNGHTGPREPCKILADGGSECPDYGETDLLEFATDVPTPDASLEAGAPDDAGVDAYVNDTLWDASAEGPDGGV